MCTNIYEKLAIHFGNQEREKELACFCVRVCIV